MARTVTHILLGVALVAALALASAARASAAPLDDAGYLAVADRMVQALDDTWSERSGYYKLGSGGVEPSANSNLLLVHAVAAQAGHQGPARDDHRARLIARRLVEGPPFVDQLPPARAGSQRHAPGWTNSMNDATGSQHLVFDADVVDGLIYAYKARGALDLPPETVALIVDRIHRTAHGSFWRYPAIRLNQVNWYALMYHADAVVTGRTDLLRGDLARQLARFLDNTHAAGTAGNFGPGMRFHYLPHHTPANGANVDSTEYASIVLSFSRFYLAARRAGMQPLSSRRLALVRQWARRVIAGYWTHGGYLNWDSGLGFERWHQTKKIGLAQQALIGLASAPSLQPDARYGRWAKWLFDRGLERFDGWASEEGGIPEPVRFKLSVNPQGPGSARLAVARMAGNAARALEAGLGSASAEQPPALYAYDPDIGRLAITTPAYNTAIVAVNQGAFPYGGIDLARFFDGEQEVAGSIGGRPPASFGLVVRDIAGRRVAASQVGRSKVSRAVTPLRLSKAPAGAGVSAASSVGRAYAGAFTDLRAHGSVRSSTHALATQHRFTARFVQTRWAARRLATRARYSADVLFQSWGKGAEVVAMLRDGTQRRVTGTRIALSRIAYLHVRSERSGYVVVPLSRPSGAAVHLLKTAPQSSAPTPGPTLAVQIARNRAFSAVSFSARYAPVPAGADAAAVARALGA